MRNLWHREKKMQIKEEKQRLRREYLQKRKSLQNRLERDQKIFTQITYSDWYMQTKQINTYVSYRAEVDTKALIQQAWSDEKIVAVPRVSGEEMDFYEIHSMEDLESGIKGILEPNNDCRKALQDSAVIFVPGAVFDKEGYRIGYGGGFYDRYLEKYPNHLLVGLAYECQLIDHIPREPWDKKIDYIVTEEGIYEFN